MQVAKLITELFLVTQCTSKNAMLLALSARRMASLVTSSAGRLVAAVCYFSFAAAAATVTVTV